MNFTDPSPQDPPLLPDATYGYNPAPQNAFREDPVWDLADVAGIAIFAFIAIFLSEWLLLGLAHQLPRFHHVPLMELANKAVLLIPAQLAGYGLTLGFILILLQHKYGVRFPEAIRWKAPSANSSLWFLAGGGCLALLSLLLEAVLHQWTPKSLPVEQLFNSTTSAYMISATGILVAPFMEELFFRGLLYPALARWTGRALSIVVTGALFAAIHQQQLAHAWAPLLILFVVGTVLTTVRAQTGSLAASVLVHMGYNATLFTLMFIGTHGFHDLRPR